VVDAFEGKREDMEGRSGRTLEQLKDLPHLLIYLPIARSVDQLLKHLREVADDVDVSESSILLGDYLSTHELNDMHEILLTRPTVHSLLQVLEDIIEEAGLFNQVSEQRLEAIVGVCLPCLIFNDSEVE
jgi:hypothetical protein